MARLPEPVPEDLEERCISALYSHAHGPWATTNYQYSALPTPTSIRLLKIYPRGGRLSKNSIVRAQLATRFSSLPPGLQELFERNLIIGSLDIVDLNDNPKFEALSYTWGSPFASQVYSADNKSVRIFEAIKNRFIVCNDRIIEITPNLYEVLRTLQMGTAKDGYRKYGEDIVGNYLWVDAICINQKDNKERSVQVAIMGNIYSTARLSLLWLGRSDQHSDVAQTVIEKLRDFLIKVMDDKELELKMQKHNPWDLESYKILGCSEILSSEWNSFLIFLQRSWFMRAWILQEVVLPKGLRLMCGTGLQNWDILTAVMFMLDRATWMTILYERKTITEGISDIIETAGLITTIRPLRGRTEGTFVSSGKEEERHNTFHDCLSLNTKRLATDPRDIVYSVLGIASEISDGTLSIVPDYDASVQQVFINATQAIIRSHKDLRILLDVGHKSSKKILDLPSWVPDFCAEPVPGSLWAYRNRFDWACGSLSWVDNGQSLDDPFLKVQGFRQGIVGRLGCSTTEDFAKWMDFFLPTDRQIDTDGQTPFEFLARISFAHLDQREKGVSDGDIAAFGGWLYDRLCRCRSRVYQDIEASEEIGAQRLSGNRENSSRGGESNKRQSPLEEFHELHGSWSRMVDAEPAESRVRRDWLRWNTNLNDSMEPSRYFLSPSEIIAMDRLRGYLNHRRGFQLTSGHMGMSTKFLDTNDEIWILAGVPVPLVLRPTNNNRYQLVGEAFLPNIMNGESIQEGRANLCQIVLE